jgi:hypothetical protein
MTKTERAEAQKILQEFLSTGIKERGITLEYVSEVTGVGYWTLIGYRVGRRFPREPFLRLIQLRWGVKIFKKHT